MIPERVIGRKVVGIEAIAFSGCTNLTEITIPGTVHTIRSGSFSGCTGLRVVSFLPGDTTLRLEQARMFWDTTLDSVYIDRDIKSNGRTFNLYAGTTSIKIGPNISDLPDKLINDCGTIKRLVIPNTIINIGADAFDNTTIEELIFESGTDTLTNGGKYLSFANAKKVFLDRPTTYYFRNSGKLQYIKAGPNFEKFDVMWINNEGTFKRNKNLKVADLACARIERSSFVECDSLHTLILREGVTNIGQAAFKACISLTEVTFPNSFTNIDEKYGAYGDGQFNGCTSLKTVNNLNCEYIPGSMFRGCTSLPEITFGPDVKVIKGGALRECTSLKSLTIPANVDEIWESIIENCDSLEELIFEDCEKAIDTHGLGWRTPIKKIYLGRNITNNGGLSLVYHSPLADERCGEEFEFGPMVTKIPNSCLRHALHLTDVTIGTGVDTIESRAFRECHALKEIFIPKNVKLIQGEAFGYCSSLEKIIIETPDAPISRSAESETAVFESNAFIGSPAISEIVLIGNTMPQIDPKTFPEEVYANAKLLVPEGQKEQYKADAAWGKFNYVEELQPTGINTPEAADEAAEITAIHTIDGTSVSLSAPLTPGIYIITYSNGTTSKQVVK